MAYVSWQDSSNPKDAAERGIVRELLDNLIGAGYAVGIDNGGDEWEVKPTLLKDKLFDNMSLSDHDVLVCYTVTKDETGKRKRGDSVGSVLLVYGNEPYELIADYNMNLEETIQPALDKMEAAEKRF